MPGMQMSETNTAGTFLLSLSSGTAVNPLSWQMPMRMVQRGSWNTMFMAQAFINDTQQSGPRGADKLYSANWFMANVEHSAGAKAAVQIQVMMSLDPLTIRHRSYPLLFQTGETAYGKALVDAQHPHDLIMAAGIQYARSAGEHTILQLSFSPVGDPAIGPVAYPHRASAAELPQATLSHHWQDSTHIANDVITGGIQYKKLRLEASGFYGSEPNENRWNIDSGPVNSWSTRLWITPSKNWAAQVSVAHLVKPEELETTNQFRSTASVHYSRPMQGSSWSSSLIWGRNHRDGTAHNTNSYLAETVVPLSARNFLTGRAELVDKDELFRNQPDVETRLNQLYGSTFRVRAFTAGYTRDFPLFAALQTGLGFNVEAYSIPAAIQPYYGEHPFGANVFLRVRLQGKQQ